MIAHLRQNVVAYLALFVALGGTTAFAAEQINSGDVQNNSLKSKDVKDEALLGKDVRDGSVEARDLSAGAVGSAAVADGSLQGADLAPNTVTGAAVDESSLAGVPRATAQVDPDGNLVFGEGISQANVSRPFAGTYCFSGLAFTPRVVVASPQNSDTLTTAFPGAAPGCADAQAVASFTDTALTAKDVLFSIIIR